MSIFFRVHENKDDPGTLYDRDFLLAGNEDLPTESDLVLSATKTQFDKILSAKPDYILLRVHEDRLNQHILEGTYYNEDFEPFTGVPGEPRYGVPVLFTITPDEFAAVAGSKG